MNSVSWFIYLAELVSKMIPLFGFSAAICFVIAFFMSVVGSHRPEREHSWFWKRMKGFAILGVVCVFMAVIIPSKTTMYLIAGSQVGEMVVTSPEAREIFNDVRAAIRSQIKGNNDQ